MISGKASPALRKETLEEMVLLFPVHVAMSVWDYWSGSRHFAKEVIHSGANT